MNATRMEPRRGRWMGAIMAAALLLLLGAGLSVAFYNNLTHTYPGANDFYIPWRASRELFVAGRNPYSAEVTRDIQIVLFGAPRRADEHQYAFAYPLPVSLLLSPLVRLPYDAAEAAWLSVCLILLMLSVAALTLPARPGKLLVFLAFGVLFYPAARSLILGQFAIVVFAAFTTGVLALRSGRRFDWLAGAAFAISALKPQMVFLALPVVVIWALQQRRFALLASGAILLGMLSGLAWLALPGWPADFLESLRAYNGYVELNSPTGIVLGDTVLLTVVNLALVAALAVYAWRQWTARWPHLEELLCFGLIVSQLIAPRTSTTNQIILLIPLLIWLKGLSGFQRAGVMVALVVVPWAVFFATIHGNEEQLPAFLFVPFFCLAWALASWFRNSRPPLATRAAERNLPAHG